MGRDRGKFNKRGGRGGSSRFQATSAAEIEMRNERLAQFDENRAKRREEAAEAENGGGQEESEEEEEQQQVGEGMAGMSLNDGAPREMTRKQREQAQKEKAAAEYRKRHEAGLTDEYKRDMAKLAEVKKRREEAKKRAEAEKEAAEAMEKDRQSKAAALQDDSSDSDSDSSDDEKKKKKKKKKKAANIPKLDKIAIKKMKPTQLKEHLKERGLDIQGTAKVLTQRLLDYEKNR